jgi:hypothetical protein
MTLGDTAIGFMLLLAALATVLFLFAPPERRR